MIHLHTVTNKREWIKEVSNCILHFEVLWKQHSIVLGEPVIVLKETDVCKEI